MGPDTMKRPKWPDAKPEAAVLYDMAYELFGPVVAYNRMKIRKKAKDHPREADLIALLDAEEAERRVVFEGRIMGMLEAHVYPSYDKYRWFYDKHFGCPSGARFREYGGYFSGSTFKVEQGRWRGDLLTRQGWTCRKPGIWEPPVGWTESPEVSLPARSPLGFRMQA